jgi:hypothetical protein
LTPELYFRTFFASDVEYDFFSEPWLDINTINTSTFQHILINAPTHQHINKLTQLSPRQRVNTPAHS